jgi:hypothetical protein
MAESVAVAADSEPLAFESANLHGTLTTGGVINFNSTTNHSMWTNTGCRHMRVASHTTSANAVASAALINPTSSRLVIALPFAVFSAVQQAADFFTLLRG